MTLLVCALARGAGVTQPDAEISEHPRWGDGLVKILSPAVDDAVAAAPEPDSGGKELPMDRPAPTDSSTPGSCS